MGGSDEVTRFHLSERTVLVGCAVTFIVGFILDVTSPVGYPLDFFYLVPIALSLLLSRPQIHYYFAILATILSLIVLLVNPSDVGSYPIGSHLMTIAAFWIVAGIIDNSKAHLDQAVREANEIEALMDVVPAAIWIAKDPKARTITGNAMADSFYEAKEGENVSSGPSTDEEWDRTRRFFQDGRELKPSELPMQQAAEKGVEIKNSEVEVLLPSGQKIVILGNARPLWDGEGKVRGSVASFVNITERKLMEAMVEQGRRRFQSLFDASNEGIALHELVIGADGHAVDYRIVNVNPAFEAATGIPRMKAIGAMASELYGTGEPPYLDLYANVERTGEPADFETHFPPMKKDFKISVFTPGKGQFATIFIDITETKRHQEQLARSNTSLQEFAYVASHDLQEPLRMVVSYLELLERRTAGELDEKSLQYLRFAVDGGVRMRKMIDDLLAYSRVESMDRQVQLVDMSEVFGLAAKNLEASVVESGASVTSDPLPTVLADRGQMTQVLTNLLSNAIKYRNEAPPQIHVSAVQKENEFIFAVQDNGIGIDPKYHDRIFKRFQRLHTRDEYLGTGIGLAIVRKIIELHGGRVWVESEDGHGATFYFTLPTFSA
jgi:signal transduction histidine kinase